MAENKKDKIIRMSEVREHNNCNSAWIVIHNVVYDITKFLDEVGYLNS